MILRSSQHKMKVFLAILFSVVLFISAMGQEIHGVPFSIGCSQITDIELSRGSRQVGLLATNNRDLYFETDENNATWHAQYDCEDNEQISQQYWTHAPTREEASAIFESKIAETKYVYGAPCRDFRTIPMWKKLYILWFKGVDRDTFNTLTWDLYEGESITWRMYEASHISGTNQWRVLGELLHSRYGPKCFN